MSKDKKHKEEKIQHEKEEINWKDKYLRALADYQNLERRTYNHIQDAKKRSNKELLLKFLEILDDIEAAEEFVKDAGLKIVKDKFISILKSEGVVEIDLMGTPYDPHFAECVEVASGTKDNIIVEIVKKGYKLNDEILRVARVKVEKKIIN